MLGVNWLMLFVVGRAAMGGIMGDVANAFVIPRILEKGCFNDGTRHRTAYQSFQSAPTMGFPSLRTQCEAAPQPLSGRILLAERSVNKVMLVGLVDDDLRVRKLPNGDRVVNLSLATSESWRDKSTNDIRSRTEWHSVVLYDPGLAEIVEKFVRKGRRLYLEGGLQTRRWIAPDGREKHTTEMVIPRYRGEMIMLDAVDDQQSEILEGEQSANRVTLVGRVGNDPDVRQLPSGDKVANLSLATSESWRDKATGDVRSRTEWHRVVVYDPTLAEVVENCVRKGRRLHVEGALQTRRWVAADTQERITTEVVISRYRGGIIILDSPEDRHGDAQTPDQQHGAQQSVSGGRGLYDRTMNTAAYPDPDPFA